MNRENALLDAWYARYLVDNKESIALSTTLSREILKQFEEALAETLQVEEICVVITDTAARQLKYATCDTVLPIKNDGGSIVLECFYTQRKHNISHARSNALYRKKIDNPNNIDAEHIFAVPLVEKGETIAVLRIATIQKERTFTPDEGVLIEAYLARLTPPILTMTHPGEKQHTKTAKQKTSASLDDLPQKQQADITVLAIDDSTIMLRLLRNYLLKDNIKILIANSGREGIDLFATNKIDLIFMDEIMEGFSGHETIEHIRIIEKESTSDPVPILGLTTDDSIATRERMLQAGAADVLYKPIFHDTLYSAIKKYTDIS